MQDIQRFPAQIGLSATLAMVLLGGCAGLGGSDEAPALSESETHHRVQEPSWYKPGEGVNFDQDSSHIYGYGMSTSESRSMAETLGKMHAKRDIAQGISEELSGVVEETESDMGTRVSDTARSAYRSFFDNELHGVQVSKRALFRDTESDVYEAYYRVQMPRERFKEAIKSARADKRLQHKLPLHEQNMQVLEELTRDQ